jgi:hypothetical protein
MRANTNLKLILNINIKVKILNLKIKITYKSVIKRPEHDSVVRYCVTLHFVVFLYFLRILLSSLCWFLSLYLLFCCYCTRFIYTNITGDITSVFVLAVGKVHFCMCWITIIDVHTIANYSLCVLTFVDSVCMSSMHGVCCTTCVVGDYGSHKILQHLIFI